MVMVEPPETPPAFVEDIERPMVECGLNRDRVRIVLSAEHQRIEIYVPDPSNANDDTVSCLIRSRGLGRYIFEDESLRNTYNAMLKILHDQVYEMSRAELRREGKLESLPKRQNFSSDADFAQELEKFCGFSPGSVLQVNNGSTIFYPPDPAKALSDQESIAYSCMSATMSITALEKEQETWSNFELDASSFEIESDN